MRPNKFVMTSTGVSAWIPVDYRQENFQLSIGCVITGAPTYTIEYTLDNIFEDVSPSVFSGTAQTANSVTTYVSPIFAFRVNYSAGTGTVTVSSLQQSGD